MEYYARLKPSWIVLVAVAAKWLQSWLTLCDPIDGSPLGSPVPGILQARTLEWVAISFFNAWKWKVKEKSLSHVRLYRPHALQPIRVLYPRDFPGKSTGVGCHCLLHIIRREDQMVAGLKALNFRVVCYIVTENQNRAMSSSINFQQCCNVSKQF